MRRRNPLRLALLAIPLVAVLAAGGRAQTTGDAPLAGADSLKASGEGGAQVYGEICQACHMADAKGASGAAAIPALAANPHLADADFMIATILRGKGGMPAFNGMLEADQIAQVATYVRNHFGNDYRPAITPADVKRIAATLPPPSE